MADQEMIVEQIASKAYLVVKRISIIICALILESCRMGEGNRMDYYDVVNLPIQAFENPDIGGVVTSLPLSQEQKNIEFQISSRSPDTTHIINVVDDFQENKTKEGGDVAHEQLPQQPSTLLTEKAAEDTADPAPISFSALEQSQPIQPQEKNNIQDQIDRLDQKIQLLQLEHDHMIGSMNEQIVHIKSQFDGNSLQGQVQIDQVVNDPNLANYYFEKVATDEQTKIEQVNQVIDHYMDAERNPKLIQEEIQAAFQELEHLRSQSGPVQIADPPTQ